MKTEKQITDELEQNTRTLGIHILNNLPDHSKAELVIACMSIVCSMIRNSPPYPQRRTHLQVAQSLTINMIEHAVTCLLTDQQANMEG